MLKEIFRTRYMIAFCAILLVILKAKWPHFVFDDTSFYLTLLAAFVLLIPDIGDTVARIRKVKKGNLEIEFESRLVTVEQAVDSKVEPDDETKKESVSSAESLSLSSDELRVVKAMAESKWLLRSSRGLAKDLDFALDKNDRLLNSLKAKGCVSRIQRKGGIRWTLTEVGQSASVE